MIDFQTFASGNLKTTIIEPQQVQHRGMKVGDIMSFAKGVIAQFIRFAVDMSFLQTCAGQPDRKSVRMMITSCVAAASQFQPRCATEFRAEDDDDIFQKSALFQIL